MNSRMHKRLFRKMRASRSVVQLNIVSLIDIFAILVFYLLVSALVVEVLPNPKSLTLPQSVVEEQPRQAVVVMVTRDSIFVDNKMVMSVADAKLASGTVLSELKTEFFTKPVYVVEGGLTSNSNRGEVNILADRSIPYSVLRKVMSTCTESRFAKLSLAVLEKKS